jgi:phospholipid/cholesterol/gamma-HCH transport system permease protein
MATVPAALGNFFTALGDWTLFALHTLRGLFGKHLRPRVLLPVFISVGVQSVGVIAVTGAFIGMVLAVQTFSQFHQWGMDSILGSIINVSIVREFGPVLAAVMLAGRIGGAMAAELATMRVTDQIDAVTVLGVDPVHYLAMPRFLACLLLTPLLTVIADAMGVLGGAAICLWIYQIEPHFYWQNARDVVKNWDLLSGLIKSTAFGGVIGLIACHRGFHSRAGAAGVGRAATEAFVYSFIAILILDFFLVMFFYGIQSRVWPANGMAGPG